MSSDIDDALEVDRTGYDPTTDTYHDSYDWDGDHTLGATIAQAITDVRDVRPTDLDRLNGDVDPDALERALGSMPEGEEQARGYVRFTYADCRVTVASTGELCIDCDP